MKLKERFAAVELRKKGYSLNEIVEILHIAKGSASVWVRNISLSKTAEKRLLTRITIGQLASQKAKRAQTVIKESNAIDIADEIISKLVFNKNVAQILCAFIYYCEGSKDVRKGLSFTNSDPDLVRFFLSIFRKSFDLNEKKFSVGVHLHSYHNPKKQLKFWSKTTNIPVEQFIKPYLKPTSGLYKKEGYPGCVSVRYGSAKIARELKAVAVQFMKMGL